jgi:hypothetical protein
VTGRNSDFPLHVVTHTKTRSSTHGLKYTQPRTFWANRVHGKRIRAHSGLHYTGRMHPFPPSGRARGKPGPSSAERCQDSHTGPSRVASRARDLVARRLDLYTPFARPPRPVSRSLARLSPPLPRRRGARQLGFRLPAPDPPCRSKVRSSDRFPSFSCDRFFRGI